MHSEPRRLKVMKIRQSTLDDAEALRLRSLDQGTQQRKAIAKKAEQGEGESVTISALARDIENLDTSSVDSVRTEKVKALKEQIATGLYKVDSEEIAKKLILDLA